MSDQTSKRVSHHHWVSECISPSARILVPSVFKGVVWTLLFLLLSYVHTNVKPQGGGLGRHKGIWHFLQFPPLSTAFCPKQVFKRCQIPDSRAEPKCPNPHPWKSLTSQFPIGSRSPPLGLTLNACWCVCSVSELRLIRPQTNSPTTNSPAEKMTHPHDVS